MKKESKETKPDEQKTLFGDQDFVFNVLQTRQSDLGFEIKRCEEAIDKKKELIKQLDKDKKETEKAIAIVGKQRKDLSAKPEAGKEAPF